MAQYKQIDTGIASQVGKSHKHNNNNNNVYLAMNMQA